VHKVRSCAQGAFMCTRCVHGHKVPNQGSQWIFQFVLLPSGASSGGLCRSQITQKGSQITQVHLEGGSVYSLFSKSHKMLLRELTHTLPIRWLFALSRRVCLPQVLGKWMSD
jgi:hypothetical protein